RPGAPTAAWRCGRSRSGARAWRDRPAPPSALVGEGWPSSEPLCAGRDATALPAAGGGRAGTMVELTAPLVARREVAGGMWVLAFEAPAIAGRVRAGQFVNVLLRPGPLLRRPFSVYRTGDGLV